MRKRFTALRFVFNFGILQILPGRARGRESGALYTRATAASSLRRLGARSGSLGGRRLRYGTGRVVAALPYGRTRGRRGLALCSGGGGLGALRLQPARVRRENHEQQPAFEARGLFYHRDVLQILGDAREDGLANLAVRDLAPAEHHRAAGLVPLGEELADGLGLEAVVVLLGLGPELH